MQHVTNIQQVRVRLNTNQHERREQDSWQARHEKGGNFHGKRLRTSDEGNAALSDAGCLGIEHFVVLRVGSVHIFIERSGVCNGAG